MAIILEEWVSSVGGQIGLDTATCALLLSLVFTIAIELLALLATNGRGNIAHLIIGYACIIFFTTLGWMPYFILLLLILMTAGMYGQQIVKWVTGSGSNE